MPFLLHFIVTLNSHNKSQPKRFTGEELDTLERQNGYSEGLRTLGWAETWAMNKATQRCQKFGKNKGDRQS